MNNFTFSHCMSLLEECKTEIKYNLFDHDYKAVRRAYEKNRKVIVYIDVDYARSHKYSGIRAQLFEAAELYHRAGGTIFAMTSQPLTYFDKGNINAFTDVIYGPNFDENDMAQRIRKDISVNGNSCTMFAFGGSTMIDNIKGLLQNGDLFASVGPGSQMLEIYEDKFPLKKYTVVEYILFYLTIKLLIKNL